jgi:branched-chain amino acid transport system substrate-binding protein
VLHQPLQKHVFNVRATYQREAERAIVHLHSIGISRIGMIYVDDSFGEDGLAGAEKGFLKTNLRPVMVEKFNRSKPDFSSITPKVVESKAQAILMVAASQAIVDGLKTFRDSGSQAQLVTLSNNASSGFIKSMGAMGSGQIVMQVFPSERSIASPMVKQALDMAKAQNVAQLSPAMLEGFAAAKVLVEGLRKAGRQPTRDKLITALESLRQFDVGGLKVTYSDTSHTGLDFVDMSIIGTDGQFKR